MKPDAWIISDETTQIVRKAEHVDVNRLFGVKTEPLYSLSTIRKWLEEEISADVFQAGVNCPGSFEDTYRAMLSQKLAELEQP